MVELQLYCEQELLGTLRPTELDAPWQVGTFEPTEAFEELRPLFERELALLNADRQDEWEIVWDSIMDLGLRLQIGKNSTDDFVLHIDGTEAWWQC